MGAGGQSLRLFQLLQGPDWNLLAYETHGKVIDARRGLRIHHIGEQDELIDTLGHFRESYHLAPGQCVVCPSMYRLPDKVSSSERRRH
ncbi:hypothetical protein CB127_13560 [Salmonella enterica subsp. enterica serovar Enteritidis]|nr:hypothetical protein [Salmonella enterica subsp. enterica serovar Enteritidis]